MYVALEAITSLKPLLLSKNIGHKKSEPVRYLPNKERPSVLCSILLPAPKDFKTHKNLKALFIAKYKSFLSNGRHFIC